VSTVNARSPANVDSAFLRTLAQLRWFAALGQGLTIWVTVHQLSVPLPTGPLWMGVATLLLFNLYLSVHRLEGSVPPTLAVAHLAFDITELSWAIAWSGGAMNPFVSLFLVPIAMATLALPVRHILLVSAMATLGYAMAAILGLPLPHVHGLSGTFDLHLAGMAVNFVLSAAVFVAVLTRLAALRDAREREIAQLREQSARAEGILGLATHAAAMAHTLNTPLGTLTLILDDLLEDSDPAGAVHADLERACTLVGHCRDQVRKLVHDADPDQHALLPLRDYIDAVIARWELLRPSMRLRKQIDLPAVEVRADPALEHLLQALLDNAADASASRGQAELSLQLSLQQGDLIGAIADQGGTALAERPRPQTLFASTKRDGLGVGLALSHATVERCGGDLSLEAGPEGAITRLRLPLERLRP
jgi:two-component system, sensor histidine kinase RegB